MGGLRYPAGRRDGWRRWAPVVVAASRRIAAGKSKLPAIALADADGRTPTEFARTVQKLIAMALTANQEFGSELFPRATKQHSFGTSPFDELNEAQQASCMSGWSRNDTFYAPIISRHHGVRSPILGVSPSFCLPLVKCSSVSPNQAAKAL
jgi:hypothetical protein